MMKEAKKLLAEVGKIIEIPKTLHPNSSPEDAVKLGQLGKVIRVYAQNGAIWDLVLADGSKRKVHQQDLAIVVCNLILDANEKTKELKKIKPEITVPEVPAEIHEAEADEIVKEGIEVPADGMEREFELGTPEELLDDVAVEISDAAAELAEANDINLADVKGTGAGGKIIKKDIQALIE